MNYDEILKQYSYANYNEITERINECEFCNETENADIINSIVLWKVNRQVKIDNNLIIRIKNLQFDKVELLENYEGEIREILKALLETQGIQIAMASNILKMFKPFAFPIIDQRAFRTIYSKDLPNFYGKDKYSKYIDLYIQYIKDCYTFNVNNCPEITFNKMDELLYQIDKVNKNKVKY